jgi:Leucine-rich repeat (LRR) protein
MEQPAKLLEVGYVDLSNQNLNKLPQWIFECTNLKELNISNNPLEKGELDHILTNLKTLKVVIAHDCKIEGSELKSISKENELTTLDVSHNQIEEVPDVLEKMSLLRELYLGSNQISKLPEHFGAIRQLTTLDLSNNQLGDEVLQTISKVQVKHLDLSFNKITKIEEKVFNSALFINNKNVNLSNNPITEVSGNSSAWKNIWMLATKTISLENTPVQGLAEFEKMKTIIKTSLKVLKVGLYACALLIVLNSIKNRIR